jgi:uncharacterized protein
MSLMGREKGVFTMKVRWLAAFAVSGLLAGSLAVAQAPVSRPATAAAAPAPAEMRMYYMVFLRRGPIWTAAATPEAVKLGQAHRANIDRLTKEGLMVVAGPFEGTSGERALAGIFILRVGSMEAAKAAVDLDPAVTAGRFVYEIVPWWGPASLRY